MLWALLFGRTDLETLLLADEAVVMNDQLYE